jgi:hypothetical protein
MNEMKDWSASLRRNAACCDLARAIYKARAEAYGGPDDFAALPPSERQDYIVRADELLKTLQPTPRDYEGLYQQAVAMTRRHFATGLRTPDSNLIGVITPDGD